MRRFLLYFALANLIGIFFLWLAARELPFHLMWKYFADVDAGEFVLATLVFMLLYGICHAARVLRWYHLVRPLGDGEASLIHRVSALGSTAILLLPLRLGELVRPYVLARRTSLSMSSIMGTVVVERVVDGLIITGLLFVTLSTYTGEGKTQFVRPLGIIAAFIFVPALLICLLALWRRRLAVRLIRKTLGWVHEGTADRAAALLDAFIEGFRGLVAGHALGRFLVLTGVYWIANLMAMWLYARDGFGFELSLWEMTTCMTILVVGIMIPAGPAGAGNFQYFLVRAMALFVPIGEVEVGIRVAAFAASLHVFQFIVIAIPGFVIMWLDPETRHLIRLSQKAEEAA